MRLHVTPGHGYCHAWDTGRPPVYTHTRAHTHTHRSTVCHPLPCHRLPITRQYCTHVLRAIPQARRGTGRSCGVCVCVCVSRTSSKNTTAVLPPSASLLAASNASRNRLSLSPRYDPYTSPAVTVCRDAPHSSGHTHTHTHTRTHTRGFILSTRRHGAWHTPTFCVSAYG